MQSLGSISRIDQHATVVELPTSGSVQPGRHTHRLKTSNAPIDPAQSQVGRVGHHNTQGQSGGKGRQPFPLEGSL